MNRKDWLFLFVAVIGLLLGFMALPVERTRFLTDLLSQIAPSLSGVLGQPFWQGVQGIASVLMIFAWVPRWFCSRFHQPDAPRVPEGLTQVVAGKQAAVRDTALQYLGKLEDQVGPGPRDSDCRPVLNSSAIWSYCKERLTVLGDAHKGGRLRFFTQFVEEIPIPNASAAEQAAIAALVQQCLVAKKRDPKADTTALEREIDRLVYELYELTPTEIKLVEEGTRK